MRATLSAGILFTLVGAACGQRSYAVDPDSVDSATRDYWCQQQKSQCPLICLQPPAESAETITNDCDPDSLTYACVCSNGLSPNVSEYSQTLPYFICTEWGSQCVSNCGDDSSCASDCRSKNPCGAQSPTRVTSTTLSATASQTGDGNGAVQTNSEGDEIFSGFAGQDGSDSTSGSDAQETGSAGNSGPRVPVVAEYGSVVGLVVLLSSMMFGFAVLL